MYPEIPNATIIVQPHFSIKCAQHLQEAFGDVLNPTTLAILKVATRGHATRFRRP